MTYATENTSVDISHWLPGTKFYDLSDGRHCVVTVDPTVAPPGSRVKVRRQPTVMLYTDGAAVAIDLVPDHVSAAGTSHEEALLEAGFDIS